MVVAPPLGRDLLALPVGRGVVVGTVLDWLRSSLRARGGQPDVSGAWGIPSSRPALGVSMKPSGHDHDELNH